MSPFKVIWLNDAIPEHPDRSIYLAGPTAKENLSLSWRRFALTELEILDFNGIVFMPEPKNSVWNHDEDPNEYENRLDWEEKAQSLATCIAFWVPRDITGKYYGTPMVGLVTNDEWGTWKRSGKVVWGAPQMMEEVRYQEYYARKLNVPRATTLSSTMRNAVDMAKTIGIKQALKKLRKEVRGISPVNNGERLEDQVIYDQVYFEGIPED